MVIILEFRLLQCTSRFTLSSMITIFIAESGSVLILQKLPFKSRDGI